jgi:hypothetical protein
MQLVLLLSTLRARRGILTMLDSTRQRRSGANRMCDDLKHQRPHGQRESKAGPSRALCAGRPAAACSCATARRSLSPLQQLAHAVRCICGRSAGRMCEARLDRLICRWSTRARHKRYRSRLYPRFRPGPRQRDATGAQPEWHDLGPPVSAGSVRWSATQARRPAEWRLPDRPKCKFSRNLA